MSADLKQVKQLKNLISDPRVETIEGVIAVGDVMSPDLLSYAYERGVFPWPHEGYPLLWFCPDERGVIELSDIKIPQSFKKWLRKNEQNYQVTFDRNFQAVIENCQKIKRKGQQGTWITSDILKNYTGLHRQKKAYSVEVWRNERLVAGLYGVRSVKYLSCESMFHLEDNTSKLALWTLLCRLKEQGVSWVDIQMVTPVSASFGGKLISKDEFLKRIGF